MDRAPDATTAGTTPLPEDDAAWASIVVPLPTAELCEFLDDIGRLLRINPCLEFERLERLPDGAYALSGRNESNDRRFETTATIRHDIPGADLVLHFESGIKRETRLTIGSDPQGSTLTIKEIYATPASDAHGSSIGEVDRSLVPWARALRAHLRGRARWQHVPGYRRLIDRFWLGMPPRQRRIGWLIIWTTLLEFVVFVAVLAVFAAS